MSIMGAAGMGSAASGAMGSAMSWLGGSTGGFSNAGMLGAFGSILGSYGDYKTEKSNAKKLKAAQEAQWQAQLADTRENYRQLGQAEQVANKEYREDLIQNQASLLQQQAQVQLLAASSGTGGASVTAMMTDLAAQGGRNQAQIVDNFENTQQGFINQAKAIQKSGQMEMREFKKPSATSAIINGIGGAAQGYLKASQTGKGFAKAYQDSRTYSSGVGK